MAGEPTSPTRAEFLGALFDENPELTESEARQAWLDAGNTSNLSTSTYYNAKNAYKKRHEASGGQKPKRGPGRPKGTSKTARRGRPPGSGKRRVGRPPAQAAVAEGRPRADAAALDRIEAELDVLLFQVMAQQGLEEVEVALRRARRLLIRGRSE